MIGNVRTVDPLIGAVAAALQTHVDVEVEALIVRLKVEACDAVESTVREAVVKAAMDIARDVDVHRDQDVLTVRLKLSRGLHDGLPR